MERISTVVAFTLASATLVAWMETATPSRSASGPASGQQDRPPEVACDQASAPDGCGTSEDPSGGADLATADAGAPELDSDPDEEAQAAPAPVYEPERTYFPAQAHPQPSHWPDAGAGQGSAPGWDEPSAPARYQGLEVGPPPPPYGYQGSDASGLWGGAVGQRGYYGAGAYDHWGYPRQGGLQHRVPDPAYARWDHYPGVYGSRGEGHGGYGLPRYGQPTYGYRGQGPAYRDPWMDGGGYAEGPYYGSGDAYGAYGPDMPPAPPSGMPRYPPRGVGAVHPPGAGPARPRIWTSVLEPLDLAAEIEVRNDASPVTVETALTVGGFDIRPFLGSPVSDKPGESHETDAASSAVPGSFRKRSAGEAVPDMPWPPAPGEHEPGAGVPAEGMTAGAVEGPQDQGGPGVSQTPGLAVPPQDVAPVPLDSADTDAP